ncbi:MAG: DUF3293 domain-containing protein, partial [Phaeodactylibacter sp.]|nr:DUF3293 domain-containing protein [Phaeodactylibacter sp.]
HWLQARSLSYFPGAAGADAGDWPPEPSLLIPDLPLETAQLLARQFGQLAFLYGELDSLSRLLVSQLD